MKAEPRVVELEFNGKQVPVRFNQLKTSDSLIFLMYLGKVIGGSAGKFIGAMDGKSLTDLVDKTDVNPDKIGDAISGLFERIGEKETIEKMNLLLSSVKSEGESLYVDSPFFDGNLPQLFKTLKIALEVNYKGFLPASSGMLKRFQNLREMMKDSSNTTKVQA